MLDQVPKLWGEVWEGGFEFGSKESPPKRWSCGLPLLRREQCVLERERGEVLVSVLELHPPLYCVNTKGGAFSVHDVSSSLSSCGVLLGQSLC